MSAGEYIDQIILQLDFDGLDLFSDHQGIVKKSFSDILRMLLTDGPQILFNGEFFEGLFSSFMYEIVELKPMMIQVLCIACFFTLGNRLLEGKNIRITKISFLMIYAMVLFLLMKPFAGVVEIVESGLSDMLSFMTAFIPTYSSCLVLMGKPVSASIFSQFTFLLIYVVEWGIKKIVFPLIHAFVFIVFLNHVFEEEKLSKLAELIRHVIDWLLKISSGCILSFGAVQSLLAPTKDKVASGGLLKGAQMIPGVGNSVDSVAEVLLGCGVIVKNSVGTTALLILFSICLMPLVKIWIVNIAYRLLAAIMEPLSDGRIVKMTHGIAQALEVYFKTMLYAMMLFVIVIAMLSASTGS